MVRRLPVPPPVRPLNVKQQRFVIEYVRDLNATAAARRAGYTGSTRGSELVHSPRVAEEIQRHLDAKAEAARLDAVKVLDHAVKMLSADIADIMTDKGAYKPISEWPLIWRQMLSACDVTTVRNAKGDEIGAVTRTKFADRVKVLELIGRHINVKAFVSPQDEQAKNGNTTNNVFINVSRMPTEQLEQMRKWLSAAAETRTIDIEAARGAQ